MYKILEIPLYNCNDTLYLSLSRSAMSCRIWHTAIGMRMRQNDSEHGAWVFGTSNSKLPLIRKQLCESTWYHADAIEPLLQRQQQQHSFSIRFWYISPYVHNGAHTIFFARLRHQRFKLNSKVKQMDLWPSGRQRNISSDLFFWLDFTEFVCTSCTFWTRVKHFHLMC